MTVERRDPVPPGRYSALVQASEGAAWHRWLTANPTVRVVAQVDKRALSSTVPVFATRWDGTIVQDLIATAVLFDVAVPTPWVGFGFPTVEKTDGVPRSIASWVAEQTENPEFIPDGAPDLFQQLQSLLLFGGAVALGVVLLGRKS
jgi:hypothetical protein